MEKSEISIETWLDLLKREYDFYFDALKRANKAKNIHEFILIVLCLLSILYFFPITEKCLLKEPSFEIEVIGLEIPKSGLLTALPIVIAAIYLFNVVDVIAIRFISKNWGIRFDALEYYKKYGDISEDYKNLSNTKTVNQLRILPWIFIPAPLRTRLMLGDFNKIEIFLFVFSALLYFLFPYVCIVYIATKASELVGAKTLFVSIPAITFMLLSFFSAVAKDFRSKVK